MDENDKSQIYKERYKVGKKLGRRTYLVTDIKAKDEL